MSTNHPINEPISEPISAPIAVAINGEIRAIPAGQTIRQLLEFLDLDPARVAVELDRRIVKPRDWAATTVAGGSHLEIVQFVGGG